MHHDARPPAPGGEMSTPQSRGPTSEAERIASLDTIRGVAVLGILLMNSLAFGALADAAYSNVSAGGIGQPLDWAIGIFMMVFVDQKMMALFSLLFGVGVVIFAERAAAKGRRVVWLSLWRFALLGVLGFAHMWLWYGDILLTYALCAPIVLLLRRLPVWLISLLGTVLVLVGPATAPFVQAEVNASADGIGGLWFADSDTWAPVLETWFLAGGGGRALGFMLIGVALYRLGIVQGERGTPYYRSLAVWGIGIGAAITAIAPVTYIASGWSAELAITGLIPIGVGLIPMALGYMALIILWSRSERGPLLAFRSAGRMALTNYLSQTILGLATFGWLFFDVDVTRTMILAWVLAVWALQLWWSKWWLARFRFGPVEWAWRCATYRSWQPLRRARPG